MRLEVPVIACVIGEGGSGGALALGVANVVLMQENACYSVITPEGCAAILWREGGPERVADAAAALKLSAPDLLRLGVADEVVPEPMGGAHQDPPRAARELGRAIERQLVRLSRGSRRFDCAASARRSLPRWARCSSRRGALKISARWVSHLFRLSYMASSDMASSDMAARTRVSRKPKDPATYRRAARRRARVRQIRQVLHGKVLQVRRVRPISPGSIACARR